MKRRGAVRRKVEERLGAALGAALVEERLAGALAWRWGSGRELEGRRMDGSGGAAEARCWQRWRSNDGRLWGSAVVEERLGAALACSSLPAPLHLSLRPHPCSFCSLHWRESTTRGVETRGGHGDVWIGGEDGPRQGLAYASSSRAALASSSSSTGSGSGLAFVSTDKTDDGGLNSIGLALAEDAITGQTNSSEAAATDQTGSPPASVDASVTGVGSQTHQRRSQNLLNLGLARKLFLRLSRKPCYSWSHRL